MQLEVQQKEIERGLNFLQKAIPSRPQLPVLSALLITAAKDVCTIAATDLYFGVRVTLQAQIKKPGVVAVPGKEFRELIQSLPPTTVITLSFSEATLTLSAGKIVCTLQCLESDDYPAFPALEGETIPIASEVIQSVVTHVCQSASLDQARPLLTGILFAFSTDSVRCVATDGFRLSILDASLSNSVEKTLVVPAKIINEVARIITHLQVKEISFVVSETLKQVYCKAQTVEIFMRLLEGEYPPYQKILPTQFATELIVSAEVLIEQARRALIYSRDSSSVMTLSLENGICSISATSTTLGSYHAEVEDAKIKGPDLKISFKTKYVLDFLTTVADSDIWIGMNESLKPVLFKAQTANQLQYVVMPFRVT